MCFLLSLLLALQPQAVQVGNTKAVGNTVQVANGGGGSGGTSAFVAAGECNSGALTCNVACTGTCGAGATFSVTAGDTLICVVRSTTLASNTLSCADNDSGGSNTYSDCGVGVVNDGTFLNQSFCAKAKATNAALTVTPTVSNSANLMSGSAGQWTGTANIVDQHADALNTATTSWTSSVAPTTTAANELLVGIMFCNTGCGTLTGTNGFTTRFTPTSGTHPAFIDQGVSSTGAYAATLTVSSSSTGHMTIVTFK